METNLSPQMDLIKIYLDVVYGYCEGWIPLRGFAEKGKAGECLNTAWVEVNQEAPEKCLTFAEWAANAQAACYVIPGTVAQNGQAKSEHMCQMQTLLVDLDAGDIDAKVDYLHRYLGTPTLIINSGGITPEGQSKKHLYWQLTEPAQGDDLKTIARLRHRIALKVEGDVHFQSLHQPIRLLGSVYYKRDTPRLVSLVEHNPLEYDLPDLVEKVEDMPSLSGEKILSAPFLSLADNDCPFDFNDASSSLSLDEVMLRPVYEGATGEHTRFKVLSRVIGHYLRCAHEGRCTLDDAWQAIQNFNQACVKEPWTTERLSRETKLLWDKHKKKHGEPAKMNPQGNSKPAPLAGKKKLSHSAVAEKLTELHKHHVAYDDIIGQWSIWQESVWRRVPEIKIKKFVADQLKSTFTSPDEGFSYPYLQSCTKMLAVDNTVSFWNQLPHTLPLTNGLLNLTTGELTEHKAQYYFNWQLPFAYCPHAQCPTTQAWLFETTQGDEGMVKILRAWLNAVVKGRVDLHRYLELIGPAGTGKSTFLKLATMLVGEDNAVTTELKQLEQNRFESASLYGKRLCLITDSSRYGGSVDVLKALTGGDALRYEEKYCVKGNSFVPQCLVMIAANEPIQASDYTSGLQRRRLTLPFNNRIAPEKRDSTLEGRLRHELPGLLNWILALDNEEVTALLRTPEAHSETVATTGRSNMTETNPLAAWLDENVLYMQGQLTKIGCCDPDGGTSKSESQLYPNYVSFCQATGNYPVAQRRFSQLLLDLCESLGYQVKRLRRAEGWMFRGLSLKYSTYAHSPSMVTGYSWRNDETSSMPDTDEEEIEVNE